MARDGRALALMLVGLSESSTLPASTGLLYKGQPPDPQESHVDFEIPEDLAGYLTELDEFIEREIRPLEQYDDNARFFDHRREDARTDWDRGGLPSAEWEALLREAVRQADAAGHYRY